MKEIVGGGRWEGRVLKCFSFMALFSHKLCSVCSGKSMVKCTHNLLFFLVLFWKMQHKFLKGHKIYQYTSNFPSLLTVVSNNTQNWIQDLKARATLRCAKSLVEVSGGAPRGRRVLGGHPCELSAQRSSVTEPNSFKMMPKRASARVK